jgi:hypothetical protein
MSMSRRGVLIAALVAVVLITIGIGLRMVGSPGEARLRRFDEQRVNDLRALASAIGAYHASRKRLPSDLAEITAWPDHPVTLRDPGNNVPYTYRLVDSAAYELCATFARPSEAELSVDRGFWAHPEGAHCYRVAVE